MTKPRPPLPAGPYLVVGLARSGQAAARALAARSAEVAGCDAGSPEGAEGLREAGVEVHLDTDGVALLERARCLVKSPGVPRQAPVVEAAARRGITIVGELELAWRLIGNPFVAVTGTNGKTTVTELLGHVWRTAGEPVAVAGNVGTPLASLAGELPPDTTVACECSSFQLEDAEAFAPECAVLLNVTPDHLDRHQDFERYLGAKLRIFRNQGADDAAVFNASDPAIRGRDLGGRGRRIAYCRGADSDCAVSLAEGAIFVGSEALIATSELSLPGPHNADNAMAVAAAASAMGIGHGPIRDALRTFPGVPHRLERVAEAGGVLYVNDSKATNVAAAVVALQAFDAPVHWIAGGDDAKREDFAPLAGRAASVHLIGEAAARLQAAVGGEVDGDLEHALAAAAQAARPGDVVLLAPACASYDQFTDFEARGRRFKELVEARRTNA